MTKLIVALVIGLGGWFIGRFLIRQAGAMEDRGNVRFPRVATLVGRLVSYGGVGIAVLILLFSSFVPIDSGHVGVVTLFGNPDPTPLGNGLHVVLPWYDVIQMSTQIQRHEAKYDAASRDIQAVHAVMAVNYRLVGERAPEVYRTIGIHYSAAIIDPAASEVLKANTALHPANEMLQQRPKIKSDVQSGLTTWLAKYGIEVKEVAIKDIRFDAEFEKAVERKQIAQQVAEQKRYEVEQATQDAASRIAKEKGEGDASRAKAEGEAAALRIRAAAESEYNQKIAASLTSVIIQQHLQKWNGQLPTYSIGSTPGLMMQLPGPK